MDTVLHAMRLDICHFFRYHTPAVRRHFPTFLGLDGTSLNHTGLQIWLAFARPYKRNLTKSRSWFRVNSLDRQLQYYSGSEGTELIRRGTELTRSREELIQWATLCLLRRIRSIDRQLLIPY
jgi:hypothetical protein